VIEASGGGIYFVGDTASGTEAPLETWPRRIRSCGWHCCPSAPTRRAGS
jgi:hypothetical protein